MRPTRRHLDASAAPLVTQQNAGMGRREDTLTDQLQPLLEPGERVSHVFIANHGVAKPSKVAMTAIAVTDRSVVSVSVSHVMRWKVSGSEVARWPRTPFADLPEGGLGFDRWTWNGLSLWLDRRARNTARDANAALAGTRTG
jgi:hypothetical protein